MSRSDTRARVHHCCMHIEITLLTDSLPLPPTHFLYANLFQFLRVCRIDLVRIYIFKDVRMYHTSYFTPKFYTLHGICFLDLEIISCLTKQNIIFITSCTLIPLYFKFLTLNSPVSLFEKTHTFEFSHTKHIILYTSTLTFFTL